MISFFAMLFVCGSIHYITGGTAFELDHPCFAERVTINGFGFVGQVCVNGNDFSARWCIDLCRSFN
jgi:hypothetical protein